MPWVFYTISVDVRRAFLVSLAALLLWVRPAAAANTRVLVRYGDSITAGLGLDESQAYPAFLQRDLDAAGYHYQVLNRGTSGATTGDAVAGLPTILALHPSVVVVEFGGNDGLRGLPLDTTRRNLDRVIGTLEAAHIRVLLAGITLPPNYGPDYIRSFQQLFRKLAAAHPHAAFVPMIYKDLVHLPGTIQPDGIHPTAKGAVIVADTIWPELRPLLRKSK